PLESIAVDTVSEDGIRVKISGATNYLLGFSNRKIIAYNNKPVSNILQQGKKYQAGDTIHFIDTHTMETYEADILVVAVNQSDASYTLKNPKAGTDYYLYAWAMSEEEDYANYSSNYVETACRTVTEAPGTIDFKGLEWETSPVGWEIEQGQEGGSTGPFKPKFAINRYEAWQEPVLAGESFFQEKSSGTASMWAISPWFKGSGRLQAVFNGAFYKIKSDFLNGNSPVFQAAVDASDSIVFEVQERGDTAWQRIGLIDSRTSWTADFNDYITDFFTPEEEFRFRMTFYQDGKTAVRPESGRFYALRSLRVEAASNCLYPVNIMVPKDSMGYRTAKVMWTDPNERSNEISYVVRYRMAGESEWMIGGRPKTPEMVLEGLRPGTDYVAEVNTVCSAEESSSAREVTFTTARNVVYQEEFNQDLPELDYQSLRGEAGELLELGNQGEGWIVYTDESAPGKPKVAGLDKSLAKVSDRWLLTPVLYSGFDGKVKMRVSMAVWLDESNERKAATGIENDTLYIYRAAERSFAQPETVGKVVIDDLTPEYRTLEFEFDVKAAAPNVFAFYLSKVKDYGSESNKSSLAINEVELGYSEDNDFPAVSSLQVYNLSMKSFTISWKGEAESYAVVSRKMSGEEYDTAYTEKNEYDFSGLEAGTRYGVQVLGYYGKNRTLAGPASKEQSVNTLEDPNSCGKPSSLMAEYTKGTDSAILRWITGRNNRSSIVHLKVNEAPTYDTVKVNVNYHTLLQLQPNAVYHWRVQGVCDTALSALSEESEFETEYETKAEREFAQGLNIRVNGKQIVVENKGDRFIKALKVYSPSGILLRTYRANTADNLFIQTDLRQGVVIIKAEGQGGESHAVKAVIM
ncbi:MAG: fibronectin type III domain-containing protein, partial [Lentimicrobiaceae bacterium]|nr:fibronectin type III domain-containing protein [Lentimicrobiaceae bacterium]